HAQRMLVVAKAGPEALAQAPIQGVLAHVAERGVAEVVPEPDGLAQVLVEREGAGDRPGDLGDLEGVGQAGAVVVAGGRHAHLGLVLEPATRLAVHDPVPVALKRRPQTAVGLGVAALRRIGTRGQRGEVGLLTGTDALGVPLGHRPGRMLVARGHRLLAHIPILTARRANPAPPARARRIARRKRQAASNGRRSTWAWCSAGCPIARSAWRR